MKAKVDLREFTIQEQYDDLDNIITTLDILIDETKDKDFKQDLQIILWNAQKKFEEVEAEKDEMEAKEYEKEIEEREREYRSMQGF